VGIPGAVWAGGVRATPAATGMPAGATVRNVWETPVGGATTFMEGQSAIDASTRRPCVRHYVKYSLDFTNHGQEANPGGNVCLALKQREMKFFGNTGADAQMAQGANAHRADIRLAGFTRAV
jgi:hypothetical protein